MYYYHFDGLGSVVALSDVNSVLVERYTYDVFGRPTIRDANGVVIEESAFANPYLFTARACDAESGLYYYRARYYDYATGRFLQPDPIGYADGLSLYGYVGNNPCGYADPWGLCKDESALERAGLSLRGFRAALGQAIPNFVKGLPSAILRSAIGPLAWDISPQRDYEALRQLGADVTSPDAYRNGNAVGRITAIVVVGVVAKRVGGKVGDGLGNIRWHHPWPQYLGGPAKQVLHGLTKVQHDAYHAGLDKMLPRQLSAEHFRKLPPEFRRGILRSCVRTLKNSIKLMGLNYGKGSREPPLCLTSESISN